MRAIDVATGFYFQFVLYRSTSHRQRSRRFTVTAITRPLQSCKAPGLINYPDIDNSTGARSTRGDLCMSCVRRDETKATLGPEILRL